MLAKPISEILHSRIAWQLRAYGVRTILDIGGTEKMKNRGFQVTDANKRHGIDGRNLPFEDNSFDATMSVATLEHVGEIVDQAKFIKEAVRVCRDVSFHWFPINAEAEAFLKRLGHKHPCIIPSYHLIMDTLNLNYSIIGRTSLKEHFLLLATMYPKLNKPELYDYIFEHEDEIFGILLEVRK